MTNGDKRRLAGKKKLRDTAIRVEAAKGKKTTEIAEEFGMARQTVSKILNSEETAEIVKAAISDLTRMVPMSLERYQDAILDKYNAAGERCAKDILKSVGVMKDRIDLNHQFPEPLVIEYPDGTSTVIGSEQDLEEKEEG